MRASIRWPSGLVQELHDLPLNHRIWIEEGSQPSRVESFNLRTAEQRKITARGTQREFDAADAHTPTERAKPDAAIETWLLAPIAAPEFSQPDLAGQTRSLSAFRGMPVLLTFWNAESACCRDVIPILADLHARRTVIAGLHILAVNVVGSFEGESLRNYVQAKSPFPVLTGSDDLVSVYNIVYRYLFDRHRDLPLPASFLIDASGNIVKVYQGPIDPGHIEHDFLHIPRTLAERLAKALPFPGITEAADFSRNYLSYGSVFFQRGYFDQAATSFQRALEDDPESAEAYYGMGSVYLNQQKTAGSARQFRAGSQVARQLSRHAGQRLE